MFINRLTLVLLLLIAMSACNTTRVKSLAEREKTCADHNYYSPTMKRDTCTSLLAQENLTSDKINTYLYHRAFHRWELNELNTALLDIDQSIDSGFKTSETLHVRAIIKRDLGRHQESLIDLNNAIEIAPYKMPFLLERGKLNLVQIRDYEAAIRDFELAATVAVNPMIAEALQEDAVVLAKIFNTTAEKLKEDAKMGSHEPYLYLSHAYLHTGALDKAEMALQDAEKRFSGFIHVDAMRCRLHTVKGEMKKAIAYCDDVVKRAQKNKFIVHETLDSPYVSRSLYYWMNDMNDAANADLAAARANYSRLPSDDDILRVFESLKKHND